MKLCGTALRRDSPCCATRGLIESWHDRRIIAGSELDPAIDEELEKADVILLLVSPDFLASRYCYGVEVRRAMERHKAVAARVIPIILRPCEWDRAPFAGLLAAPKDGKPITRWPDQDEAFLDVTRAIRAVVEAVPPQPATIRAAPQGGDSSCRTRDGRPPLEQSPAAQTVHRGRSRPVSG